MATIKWAQNGSPFLRFVFFGVFHRGKTGFSGRGAGKIPSSGAFCVTGKRRGTKREREREREREFALTCRVLGSTERCLPQCAGVSGLVALRRHMRCYCYGR